MFVDFLFGAALQFFVQDLSLLNGELAFFHKIVDQVLSSLSGCCNSADTGKKYFFDSFCNIHSHSSFLSKKRVIFCDDYSITYCQEMSWISEKL